MFENGILKLIFGPKQNQNGEWRRLHNEELQSLCRPLNIFRVIKSRRLTIRRASHVSRIEEGRKAFKILADKSIEKRHLGRPRHCVLNK